MTSLLWALPITPPAMAQTASAPGTGPNPITVLTAQSNGQTIAGHIGDTISVRLTGDAGTGGTWVVSGISSNSATQIGTVVYDPAPAGASGTFTARFAAVSAGSATITLAFVGPTRNVAAPLKTFSFTFDVERETSTAPATPDGHTLPSGAVFQPAYYPVKDTTLTFGGGTQYVGEVADGQPAGRGEFKWTSGAVLYASGTWSGHTLTGGDVTFSNGVRYLGNVGADGKLDGAASLFFPTGARIDTTFSDGKYAGVTTISLPRNYDRKNSPAARLVIHITSPSATLSGPATETLADRSRLVGVLADGQFTGPATFTTPYLVGYGDETFAGSFTDGRWQGPFRLTFSQGGSVTGTVHNGSLAGPAVTTSATGERCVGRLSRSGDFFAFTGGVDEYGLPDGRGVYGCPHEDRISGTFRHGKMVGLIVDRQTDGTTLRVNVGSRPTSEIAGAATITLKDGAIETGYLTRDGKLVGPGTYRFPGSPTVHHGRWINGALTGDDEDLE